MYLLNSESQLVIRSIEATDIKKIWKLAYGGPQQEWMKWNGPYFNDPIYTFKEFRQGPGKASLHQDDIGVILHHDEIIGEISWHWKDGRLKKWLEFGLVLYPTDTWNRGLGTLACQMWIDYIFKSVPNLQRVGITTWSGNKRMIGVANKLGMILEGRIRKVRYYDNQYFDSLEYGLLVEEWENRNWK